ncbi:hypothetical protein EC988_010068, partial [Linderina pennispora]
MAEPLYISDSDDNDFVEIVPAKRPKTELAAQRQVLADRLSELDTQIARLQHQKRGVLQQIAAIDGKIDDEARNVQQHHNEKLKAGYEGSSWPWSDRVHALLRSVFNISGFRGNQEAVINATLDNRDEVVIMPTGGGKSLCYQLPALMTEGLTLVVSPLIALMDDQVMQLGELGIDAEAFTSESRNAVEIRAKIRAYIPKTRRQRG